MQSRWVVKEGNTRVIAAVLGWAADWRVLRSFRPPGYDIWAVYDYRELALPAVDLSGYKEVVLIGWSFGVWAAERIWADGQMPRPNRAIALCGSPLPCDARYGIDPRRLGVTIRGLKVRGVGEFMERAYGTYYTDLQDYLPPYPDAECVAELENLARAAAQPYAPAIEWDRAVIGADDVIFPAENLEAFWGSRAQIVPLPHFPFGEDGWFY